MLPKLQRFPLRQMPDFFVHAQRQHFPELSVFWLPIQSTVCQGVVSISKSGIKSAVQRNTLKRQVHALLSPLLSSAKNVAVVISIKKELTPEQVKTGMVKVAQLLSSPLFVK